MKISKELKTVKFGDLKPGDVFQPIWLEDLETYFMVINRIHSIPETAIDIEAGTLNVLFPEDDVIPFDAELTLKEKQ